MQNVWWSIWVSILVCRLKTWILFGNSSWQFEALRIFYKPHRCKVCGKTTFTLSTQELNFLHKAWQYVALKTSWQFVTFKIHRPFKCRMCGKVFESAFLFEGSRLELYLEIHPEFEALRIYKPHRFELCGKATFQ